MESPEAEEVPPDQQYKCPLCLGNVRFSVPVAANCGHVFCGQCLMRLMKTARKCPVCDKSWNVAWLLHINLGPTAHACKDGIKKKIHDDHYRCLVCDKEVLQHTPTATKCGHVFCEDCIMPLAKCPNCSKKVEPDSLLGLQF